MKVLIADDHAIVRRALKNLLDDAAASCGEADSAQRLFFKLKHERWDLLILDIATS